MSSEIACSCGHRFGLDESSSGAPRVCPECGANVSSDASASGGETPDTVRPLKPLWMVMGRSPPAGTTIDASRLDDTAPHAPADVASQLRTKSLWTVMGAKPPASGEAAPQSGAATSSIETSPPGQVENLPHESPSQPLSTPLVGGRSQKAFVALVLGGLAIPLSLVAFVPAFLSKFPATIAGFTALLLGFAALGEIKRSRGRQTGTALAAAGIACGVLGMFLGPVIFSPLGRRMSERSSRRLTETHLERIGGGLNDYYKAKGVFPPGGVFRKGPDGRQERLHGWMTALLPYVGEAELHRLIDLDRPFDDPVNLTALSRDVPLFFAAGADRAKVRGRYGVAHFAGVGGEVVDEQGGYAQAGIFGVNSEVTRDGVTDGLSNTLAAGEVAISFPAWGEPENWRLIGKGLNRDVAGFGNAAGDGACFLMADGSVRFFSTRTDPRMLTNLSTRDGGERIPPP